MKLQVGDLVELINIQEMTSLRGFGIKELRPLYDDEELKLYTGSLAIVTDVSDHNTYSLEACDGEIPYNSWWERDKLKLVKRLKKKKALNKSKFTRI